MRTFVAAAAVLLSACAGHVPLTGAPPTIDLASQVPAPIATALARLGRVVAPPATAQLYAPLQQRETYDGVRVQRSQA